MPSRNAKRGRGGGPKTEAGRARSAQNARRHGLSLNIAKLEQYSSEREELARSIAGPEAGEATDAVAQQIADAEFDLRRVRQVREELFTELAASVDAPIEATAAKITRSESALIEKIRILEGRKRPLKNQEAVLTRLRLALERLKTAPGASRRRGASASPLDQLISIERYERRALSRRRKAISKLLEISDVCED